MVSFFKVTQVNTGLSQLLVQPRGSVGHYNNDREPTNCAFIDGIYGPVRTDPFAGAFHLYGWGYRGEQPNIRMITIDAAGYRPALMTLLLSQKTTGRVRTAIGTTLNHRQIDVYSGVVIAEISSSSDGLYYVGYDELRLPLVVTFACQSSYYYSEHISE